MYEVPRVQTLAPSLATPNAKVGVFLSPSKIQYGKRYDTTASFHSIYVILLTLLGTRR
jgi:hypothetical protein